MSGTLYVAIRMAVNILSQIVSLPTFFSYSTLSKTIGHIKFLSSLWNYGERGKYLSKSFLDSVKRILIVPLLVSDLIFMEFLFKYQLKSKSSF